MTQIAVSLYINLVFSLELDFAQSEIEILKQLDHPNIIKIYDIFEDHNKIYITMEYVNLLVILYLLITNLTIGIIAHFIRYCKGGELTTHINTMHKRGSRLTEKYVATLMRDLLSAVSYIHRVKRVAHK